MIGSLHGKIIDKQAPFVLIELMSGLGYEIQVSMSTFYQLPALQEELLLYTHFSVREDGHFLYGFSNLNERSLFRSLIKVSGVGPKVALAILSSVQPQEFKQYISTRDIKSLQRLPGIGKKTAERLIIEMQDRLAEWEGSSENHEHSAGLISTLRDSKSESIAALVTLGYKTPEANRIIQQVFNSSLSSEELIRLALRQQTVR